MKPFFDADHVSSVVQKEEEKKNNIRQKMCQVCHYCHYSLHSLHTSVTVTKNIRNSLTFFA